MKLRFAAVAADGVVGGGVDMPPLEVHGRVVVGEAWVGCPVAVVCDGEGGPVAPVVEVAGDGACVGEARDMVEG